MRTGTSRRRAWVLRPCARCSSGALLRRLTAARGEPT